jgi:hypothetical protein
VSCRHDDAYHGWTLERYDFVAPWWWENSMNIKHLPQLSAQALNEKQVELFNEFLHPEAQ